MRRVRYNGRTRRRTRDLVIAEASSDLYRMPFLAPLQSNSSTLEAARPLLTCPASTAEVFAPLDHSDSISIPRQPSKLNYSLENRSRSASIESWDGSDATFEGFCGAPSFRAEPALSPQLPTSNKAAVASGSPSHAPRKGDELKPLPLPPVIAQEGATEVVSYASIPVMHHPEFVQIGPQEFYGARARADPFLQLFEPSPEPPQR
jgi:hypothetical protein